jgi:SAM-dependent methyltransferase
MSVVQMTPFRQLIKVYGAILGIQGSLSKLASEPQRLASRIEGIERERNDELAAQVRDLTSRMDAVEAGRVTPELVADMIKQRIFVPTASTLSDDAPFMEYSTCSASSLLHPQYFEICRLLDHPPLYHRKLWEWAFIIHHLREAGVLSNGRRGLGFGVGQEKLPAVFASHGCDIVATDAPPEIGVSRGWAVTGQHSSAISQLRFPKIVSDEIFDERVTHRACDMNDIDPTLTGFDFAWSSCCFEHLGSLEAGLQFVVNSVEKTLKPGGVAVHTTEYNLTSNDETVENGPTVIYRKKDIEKLVATLRDRGHDVRPFAPAPDAHPLDFHVDAPPYINDPHLKLRLMGHTTTSVGIIVRRAA